MNFSFYVHDLYYEIGHSNVTIDMINNLPSKENDSFHFVVFSADKKAHLFPDIVENITYHFVPFPRIKPIFLKIIFYQFYSLFYSLIFDRKRKRISLGISNFNCHISIIHFIHKQWSSVYFKTIKLSFPKRLYKKLFFKYLNLCEFFFFKKKNLKTITVADFLKDFLVEKHSLDPKRVHSIHSGFNLKRFGDTGLEQTECLARLIKSHPQLERLDPSKPICLFIGAFERKGLDRLLKKWKKNDLRQQLVIIGEGEGKYDLSSSNTFHVKHTQEINLFYEIADYFFFPTIYEPFGMVLIEAAIKGLRIITNGENVGASEILKDIEEITVNRNEEFHLPIKFKKLAKNDRALFITNRKLKLASYNWKEVSKKYVSHLR